MSLLFAAGPILGLLSTAPAAAGEDVAWEWHSSPAASPAASSEGSSEPLRFTEGDKPKQPHQDHVVARQEYLGDVRASVDLTATFAATDAGETGGGGSPAVAGAASAFANYLAMDGRGSTTLEVTQRHAGNDATGARGAVIAEAAFQERTPEGQSADRRSRVSLDVIAIGNFLGVDLRADDPNYTFEAVIDQDSGGDVTALVSGFSDETAIQAGPTDGGRTTPAATSTGGRRSTSVSTTAISNYTSLRFDSSSGTSESQ